MIHEAVFQPRATEINFAGHVSNTVLPVWYEEALQAFLRQKMRGGTFPYLVVRMDQLFKREMFHGTDVVVKTSVQKIGNTSITLFQEAWQNDTIAAEATTVLVNVSDTTNRPVPLTDELCKCLSEYLKEIEYEDS
jgi:acyl-CoA thioester hydrolase